MYPLLVWGSKSGFFHAVGSMHPQTQRLPAQAPAVDSIREGSQCRSDPLGEIYLVDGESRAVRGASAAFWPAWQHLGRQTRRATGTGVDLQMLVNLLNLSISMSRLSSDSSPALTLRVMCLAHTDGRGLSEKSPDCVRAYVQLLPKRLWSLRYRNGKTRDQAKSGRERCAARKDCVVLARFCMLGCEKLKLFLGAIG